MEKLSYYEIQSEVLGSFYLNTISYGQSTDSTYDSVIEHLLDDYETGFSIKQQIMINTIIYGLCGNFVSASLSAKLKKEIAKALISDDFYMLLKLLPHKEREDFLEDLLGLSLIDKELQVKYSNMPTIQS